MYDFLNAVMLGCKCVCGARLGIDHIISVGTVLSRYSKRPPTPGAAQIMAVAKCPRCSRSNIGVGTAPTAPLKSLIAYECGEQDRKPFDGATDLPHWMVDAFEALRCSHCLRDFASADVVGLQFEVIVGKENTASLQHHVIVQCAKCGIEHILPAQVQFHDFLAGAQLLAHLRLLPPTDARLPDTVPMKPAPPKRRGMKPSRRVPHPAGPITEAEVDYFISKLRRVSWRRESKTFRRWAFMMGFDADAPPPKEEKGDAGDEIPF